MSFFSLGAALQHPLYPVAQVVQMAEIKERGNYVQQIDEPDRSFVRRRIPTELRIESTRRKYLGMHSAIRNLRRYQHEGHQPR